MDLVGPVRAGEGAAAVRMHLRPGAAASSWRSTASHGSRMWHMASASSTYGTPGPSCAGMGQHLPPITPLPGRVTEAAVASQFEAETVQGRPHCISWARPLNRIFEIAMQHYPNCGSGHTEWPRS